MANNRPILQRGFGAGEVSPRMLARQTTEIARQSCRSLKNAIIDRFGSARKRRGFWRVDLVDGGASPVTLPTNGKRVIPFQYRSTEYILFLYATGSGNGDPARMKLLESTAVSVVDRSDDGSSNAYYDFDGWTLADLEKVQYAQNDDRIYLVTENAPPHVLYFDGNDQVFRLRRVGDNTSNIPLPGPPVRSWAPPFQLTLNADTKNEAEPNDSETTFKFNITSDRPLFRAEDCGNERDASGRTPGIYMFNYAGQSNYFRPYAFNDPSDVDVVILTENRATLIDGLAFGDWYGPWKPVDVDAGDITFWPAGGGGAPNYTAGGDQFQDATVSTADTLRVGDLISMNTSGANAFDNVFEVVGMRNGNSGGYNVVLRALNRRANLGAGSPLNVRGGDVFNRVGTGTGITGPYQIYRPERVVDELNLFRTHRYEITQAPADATIKFFDDEDNILREYTGLSTTPRPQFTFNGGWVEIDNLSTDAAVNNSTRYVEINPPDNEQLWTSIAEARANSLDGYPATVAFHQDRLWYGGFTGRPLTLCASATGRYDDWDVGAEDDDALLVQLQSDYGDRIQWIKSGGDLLVGTERTEYAISGEPITPTQIGVDSQSAYGATDTQAEFAGAAVLFVGRDGRSLREMTFRFEVDRYQAPDLADLAEHLFERTSLQAFNGMKRIQFLQYPDPLVLALREDGTLCAMSYKRENQVFGWSEWAVADFDTASTIEDFCVLRIDDFDEVWALSSSPYALGRIREDTQLYTDWGYPIPSGDISGTTVSNIPSFYNGERPRISSGGKDYGSALVSGGSMTLRSPA